MAEGEQDRTCRCCGGEIARTLQVPSWRTPDWEEFPYGECGRCGSLTLLADVDPTALNAAFRRQSPPPPALTARQRRFAAVAERTVLRRIPVMRPLARFVKGPEWMLWLAGSGLDRTADVLEVGMGNELSLAELHRWGFTHLAGIDPTLPAETEVAPGVRVQVSRLDDVGEASYDLVVFHDSLEHLDEPARMLGLARSLLRSSKGRVAVATAIAEGPVWQQYRENWRGLDAPIHRCVPTLAGLSALASAAGLELVRMRRGCPSYDLVGSERIARRIPMRDAATAMSPVGVAALEQRAAELARRGEGPQVTAVFRPASSAG